MLDFGGDGFLVNVNRRVVIGDGVFGSALILNQDVGDSGVLEVTVEPEMLPGVTLISSPGSFLISGDRGNEFILNLVKKLVDGFGVSIL